MTRKDYELIAKAIKNAVNSHYDGEAQQVIANVAKELAVSLRNDNERFDAAKFYSACMLRDYS